MRYMVSIEERGSLVVPPRKLRRLPYFLLSHFSPLLLLFPLSRDYASTGVPLSVSPSSLLRESLLFFACPRCFPLLFLQLHKMAFYEGVTPPLGRPGFFEGTQVFLSSRNFHGCFLEVIATFTEGVDG